MTDTNDTAPPTPEQTALAEGFELAGMVANRWRHNAQRGRRPVALTLNGHSKLARWIAGLPTSDEDA